MPSDKRDFDEVLLERSGYLVSAGDGGSPPWPCLEFKFEGNEFLDTIEASGFALERKCEYIRAFKLGSLPLDFGSGQSPGSVFLLFGKNPAEALRFDGERLPHFTHRNIPKEFEGKFSGAWDVALNEMRQFLTSLLQPSKTAAAAAPSLTTRSTTSESNSIEAETNNAPAAEITGRKILPVVPAPAVMATTKAAATRSDKSSSASNILKITEKSVVTAIENAKYVAPEMAVASTTESAISSRQDNGSPRLPATHGKGKVCTPQRSTLTAETVAKTMEDIPIEDPDEGAERQEDGDIDDYLESEMTDTISVSSPGCGATVVTTSPPGEAEEPTKAVSGRKKDLARDKKGTSGAAKAKANSNAMAPLVVSKTATRSDAKQRPSNNSEKDQYEPVILKRTDEKIPTFDDVKGALVGLGYTFPRGKYCRPGYGSFLSSGDGCFNSEEAFRKYLCENGVEGNSDKLNDEDRVSLVKWVRFAIVSSKEFTGMFPDLDPLGTSVFKTLKALGIKRESLYDAVLPGASDLHEGVTAFLKYDGPGGLYEYLARHGLPEGLFFDRISKTDRLRLEIYLAMHRVAEAVTFIPSGFMLSNRDVGQSSHKRSAQKREAEVASTSIERSTSKRPKMNRKMPSSRSNSSTKRAGAKNKMNGDLDQSQAVFPRISGVVTSPLVAKASQSVASPPVASRLEAAPDREATIGKKLEASLEVLKTSYQASAPVYNNNATPRLASNLQMVESFVRAAIESEGNYGGKQGDSACIYICGGPGIGKTSGIKHVCERVIQAIEVDDDCRVPVLCYVNAVSIRASRNPMESLFGELAYSAGFRSGSTATVVKQLLSRKPKKCIILILDEIDALVSDVTAGGPSNRSEQALQAILDCAADDDYPLALIGISNTIGNGKFDRIHSMCKFHRIIEFRRYRAPELRHILESRLGTTIVAPLALELMCKKVAQASGDVRAALDMVADAVKYRLESLTPMERNAIVSTPKALVTLKDHTQSVKLAQDNLAERIQDIPLYGKIVLCVLVTLARGEVQFAKIKDLRECVTSCLGDFPDELQTMAPENFMSMLETLVDQNVLKMDQVPVNLRDRLSTASYQQEMVRLGTQLEDVSEVVRRDMVDKQGFWAKIEHQARMQWNLMSDK